LRESDGVDIVIRCEVDGVLPAPGKEGGVQLVVVKALNEFDFKAQVRETKAGGM
jgi:hypothetical protein